MKQARTKPTVWLLAVAVTAIVILGAWMPQWFLNRQIRSFLWNPHKADDVFQNYQFASEEDNSAGWIKQDFESPLFQEYAAMAVNTLSELTQNGVLPACGEEAYYCLAIYGGEDAGDDETGLWKAVLYTPGTKCTAEYFWDDMGHKQISLKCDAGEDVSYLPEPVKAASALPKSGLLQSGSVFSLCSDTAFVQENDTKALFCIRSRLVRDTLHFSLTRVNP